MDRMKRKRLLGFEQLDARIAMNADMRPFFEMGHDAMPVRVHDAMLTHVQDAMFARMGNHLEYTARTAVWTSPMQGSRPNQELLPSHDWYAPQRSKNTDIPEGESTKAPPKTPSNSQSPQSPRIVSGGSNAAIILVPVSVFFVNPNQVSRPLNLGAPFAKSSVADSIASEITTLSNSTSNSVSHSPDSLLEIPTQSLRQESVAVKPVQATPAPIAGTSFSESVSNTGVSRSGYQIDTVTTASFKPSTAIVSPKELGSSVNSFAATKSIESMKSSNNGMFEFSLRNSNDQAKAERNRSGSVIGNASMSSNDQAILAEMDRPNLGLNSNLRKLPAPKGMIEIGDIAEVTKQSDVVYRASNSPFEILQLVLGSNSDSTVREGSDRMDEENSAMSSDLATREESIFALTIGALFALAIRKKRKSKSPFHLLSVSR